MNKAAGGPMNMFVVEDAPEIRKRLVAMVRRVDGIKVVGESETVSEAIEAAEEGTVDLLLLGLKPMAGDDLDGLARMKRVRPKLRAIVLTNSVTPQYRQASLSAGAEYCLDKSQEFGLVPGILRSWLAASGDRPVA